METAGRYEVIAKIVSAAPDCPQKHKVGQQWKVTRYTPEGICAAAYNSIHPYIRVLEFGGSFPFEKDPDVAYAACPDGDNPVVFEIRRVGPEPV